KVVNALLAHAVRLCAEKRLTHLVYGSYSYHGQVNSLSEFKRRHGFTEVKLPRYYIPLTAKGRLALRLRCHQGWVNLVPGPVLKLARQIRSDLNTRREKRTRSSRSFEIRYTS